MIVNLNHINSPKYQFSTVNNNMNAAAVSLFSSTKNSQELDKLACLNKMQISFSGIQKINDNYKKHDIKNYAGCIVGGAIGDAMGRPLKYFSNDKIRETYGKVGPRNLILENGLALISENTHMTFFTADGIIKSAIKQKNVDKMPDMRDVYASYQNWRKAQTGSEETSNKGWIYDIPVFHINKPHEFICKNLLESGLPGSIEFPINYLRDSDGIIRTAPVGLQYYKNPELAFEAGARCASLTHGSPSAYLPAGLYAAIIANIVQGKDMETAVDDSLEILKKYKGSEDIVALVDKAKKLASSMVAEKTAIRRIGAGWNADEAIAIGIYCALKSPDDFKQAVLISVNHGGNSNATGSIAGGLVGTYAGTDNIPAEWKKYLELSGELNILAKDLFTDKDKIRNKEVRYPV